MYASLNQQHFMKYFRNIANMASAGKEPPDDILTKYYKCHPQTRVGAVLCAICLNFYHTGEIVTKYNNGCPVKFINNALIICQNHPNVALTSNLPYGELSSKALKLIADPPSYKRTSKTRNHRRNKSGEN